MLLLDTFYPQLYCQQPTYDSSLLNPVSHDAFRPGINLVPFNCGLIEFCDGLLLQ